MPQFKVLITDYAWSDLDIECRILSEIEAELIVATAKDPETLAGDAADVDAIMTCWALIPEQVIAAAPKCRIISRLGIGLDNIDVDFATRKKIVVTNVPDYCLTEVAEHAMALLLAMARKIAFYHHESKSGRYSLAAGPTIARVEGQTLGIIGLGHIGRRLAAKALGIGLEVIATDCSRENPMEGVAWCDLDELLEQSDYISVHLPLVPETRHMLGAEQFARMKSSAYLINTARGGLIDHKALAAALTSGQLAGAALDVQEPEPPDLSKPPFNDPRVIVTPHAAFVSTESLMDLRRRTAKQVATFLSGGLPENIVNPSVLQ